MSGSASRFPRTGLVYELLTPNMQGSLEIFQLDVRGGYDGERRPLAHRGEKFLHVQRGRLCVNVGSQRWELGPGDSITFDASGPHWIQNRASQGARILVVVTPPSF
jgi:uncharacterized cupin superfamily protein